MTQLTANKIVPNLLTLIPTLPDDSIISRSVYKDKQIKVILFAFAAGETLSEHTSSYAAILHFIEGEADVTLGEEKISAEKGTWVHMPANLPHSIVAKTEVQMLLLMIT